MSEPVRKSVRKPSRRGTGDRDVGSVGVGSVGVGSVGVGTGIGIGGEKKRVCA